MITTAQYTDNTYYKHVQPPQAYVPYSPAGAPGGLKPSHPQAMADDTMLGIAVAGLCAILVLALPVGLITGPWALKRARRAEELVAKGHRPGTDSTGISATRVLAWISLALSGAITVAWLGVAALVLGILLA